MNMKHYKNPVTNELYGYAADGSQDSYIKPELVPISDEEHRVILEQIRMQTAAVSPQPVVDPVEKLRIFLERNPEVRNLVIGNS